MFSPSTRLLLIILAAGLGLWQLSQGRSEGIVFLLAGLVLTWGYFRYGTVQAAFAAYRRGDPERAQRLLDAVADPERLTPQSRAYYHWLAGMLHARAGRVLEARDELLRAVAGALRTENDRALAHCQLAALAGQAGDRAAAENHLEQARSLKHRPEVARMIEQTAALTRNPPRPSGG